VNLGRSVVSFAVINQEMKPFLDAGMNLAWLHSNDKGSPAIFDGEDTKAYAFLLEHFAKHHKTPPREVFEQSFPRQAYKIRESDATSAELVELAEIEVSREVMGSAVASVAEKHDAGDISGAVEVFKDAARVLAAGIREPRGTIVTMGDPDFDLEEFLARQMTMGVPMGIASIDEDFYGWQGGQLITFLGRQKSTKSSLALWSAYQGWVEHYSSVFYTIEMSEDVVMQRLYAMAAGANPERFRRGQLRDSEKRAIRAAHEEFVADKDTFIKISKRHARLTIEDVRHDIEELGMDSITIDGFYFMYDPATGKTANAWDANENLAAELNALALEFNIPIVVTTQVQEKQHNSKKRGVEAASIQAGTGLLKASSLILGMDKNMDDDVLTINNVFSRFAPVRTVNIRWDWDIMFPDVVEDYEPDVEGLL
jgi:DnaB-like helicase C terminal domain